MLHVAQSAVAIVWGCVRIGGKFFRFFGNRSLRVTLDAGVLVRILKVVHIGAMAHLAGNATGNMTI